MPDIFINEEDSEADTCRKEVLPKLYECGWTDEKILEQRTFTDGKIIVIGRKAKRKKAKRFDYLLRYSPSMPLAIVEAKKKYKSAGDGMQQAKEYAQILGLSFAYSTNGTAILEFDFTTGIEQKITKYPTPDELWERLNKVEPIKPEVQEILLKPFFPIIGKPTRYYQQIAINRAVKAILEGEKRALLTLATGTGKTTIAFQIIYRLWNNRWNCKGEHRKPKILFLADRSILVSDPHAKEFAVFGAARCLVPEDGLVSSREIYFSTYQSLAEDANRIGAFRNLPTDFFDLIVIDECHRGSANDESNWRVILDYFQEATQLGLTATPKRDDNADTYDYFGKPLYTYSLKQGIEDGFLAPYIVHRVVSQPDATGFRPQAGQLDDDGQLIPDEIYTTNDFENKLSYLPRTKAVAKHLYEFMLKNGRFDKTIVFCVNQQHADDFRREISNLNADLVQQYSDYVVRIVSEEGDIGKGHLSNFMEIEKELPVIATTVRLLSTGVDVQTCKNVVIFSEINSMTEFKQIIGRGTRVKEDKGKLFFTIIDYTGAATRKFADPEFDGEPADIEGDEEDGEENEGEDNGENEGGEGTTGGGRRQKFRVSEGIATIVAETVQILDANGKLRTIQFTQFAKEQIMEIFPDATDLRNKWKNAQSRQEIIEMLEENGISIEQLTDITNLKDADPFDLLCFVAYNMKPLTRKQRAEILQRNKSDFFANYSEKAREILNMILDKYVEYGLNQIKPDIISVEPISRKGNAVEIIKEFGGMDAFKKSIEKLQNLLYSEAA